MAIDKDVERFQHYVATVFGNMTIEYVYEDNLKTNEMRTPNELRIDYVKNSGNWLQWIKGVQDEAWNAALDRLLIEVNSSSLLVETKELVNQMVEVVKK
jgi:hypothetical protein